MLVYLTHPQHGVHIAYDQGEVDRCVKNGWKLRVKELKVIPAVDMHDSSPVEEVKKRGRLRKAG